jgi:hypothetical protein
MKTLYLLSLLLAGQAHAAPSNADYLTAVSRDAEVLAFEDRQINRHNLACEEPTFLRLAPHDDVSLAFELRINCHDVNGGANATGLIFTGKVFPLSDSDIRVRVETSTIRQSE